MLLQLPDLTPKHYKEVIEKIMKLWWDFRNENHSFDFEKASKSEAEIIYEP